MRPHFVYTCIDPAGVPRNLTLFRRYLHGCSSNASSGGQSAAANSATLGRLLRGLGGGIQSGPRQPRDRNRGAVAAFIISAGLLPQGFTFAGNPNRLPGKEGEITLFVDPFGLRRAGIRGKQQSEN